MNMVVNLDEYVPATEAADMLGLKYPTLWARIKRGRVPTIQVGRFHLVKLTVIEEIKEKKLDDNTTRMGEAAR